MSLIVRCERARAGLEFVRSLRRQVFVEEERYMLDREQLLEDDWDVCDRTFHIFALCGRSVIGAVRFTLDSGDDSEHAEFDFSQYLAGATMTATGGKLCIARDHRSTGHVFRRMMACAYAWLHADGVSHVKAVVNPCIRDISVHTGYKVLSDVFTGRTSGLPSLAILMDLREAPRTTRAFIDRHRLAENVETYRRGFMLANASVSVRQLPEFRSFAVISGRAGIRRSAGRQAEKLTSVVAGDGWVDRVKSIHSLTDVEMILRDEKPRARPGASVRVA
ncbi:MAG: hypothetical protein WB810_09290 [Candidatus Cybelea sp.]